MPLTWQIVLCCSGNWVVRKSYWLLYSISDRTLAYSWKWTKSFRFPVHQMLWRLRRKEVSIVLDRIDGRKKHFDCYMLILHLLFLWKEGYFSWTCSSISLGARSLPALVDSASNLEKKMCLGQYSCHHWNSESYHWLFNVGEGWNKAHIFSRYTAKIAKVTLFLSCR